MYLYRKKEVRHELPTLNIIIILHGLSIRSTRKILCTTVIPKAYYLAHLWDWTHSLSLYYQLKEMLHTPFHPLSESLHVFSDILPVPIFYTKMRLGTVKQIAKLVPDNIRTYPKSKLALLMLSELAKLLKVRVIGRDHSSLNVLLKSTPHSFGADGG